MRPALALCVYLACHPDRHHREHLMGLLWPDYRPDSAHRNLRQAMYMLRQSLPQVAGEDEPVSLLLADRETVQLNPDALVEVDVRQFTALLSGSEPGPRQMAAAVALYRGDFLSDFFLPDSSPFEAWAAARRADLRRLMLDALDGLAIHAEQQGRHAESAAYARRQLEIDNLRESASRQLMLALAMSGQRSEALAQFKHCERLLRDELGVEPAAETRALAERISHDNLTVVAEWPSGPSGAPPGNLPSNVSSFIGREHEIAVARVELARSRLLTLTGPGGCGKTRLAVEVARSLQTGFAEGAWLVEFAALTEPSLVGQTVANVLGLTPSTGGPIEEALAAHLRERLVLLVLDNCEHLIEACAQLVDTLLRACPRLYILVTSRAPLRVSGEVIRLVPPLALAAPGHLPVLSDLATIESIRLFVERAQAVCAGFSLAEENGAAIASICRHLDGMPLAIELAATRVNMISVQQIVQRLDDRFRLLTLGSRTAPPRQQTLQATIDWSFGLLSEPEQALLGRLSVFSGGWTLDAAEIICSGDGIEAHRVLDHLSDLVDKSLVQSVEHLGMIRFSMLETIRQYGMERLRDRGQEVAIRERHTDYFLGFAAEGDRELRGPRSLEWMHRIEREHDNLRAALEYAFSSDGPGGKGVAMASILANEFSGFWEKRGYWDEALFWLEKALQDPSVSPGTAHRAKLLLEYAIFANTRLPWEKQRQMLEESLATLETLGEPHHASHAYVLTWFGLQFYSRDDKARGLNYMREALRLYEAANDPWGKALVLSLFADPTDDIEVAWRMVEEGLVAARQAGDPALIATLLSDFGMFEVMRGHYSQSLDYLNESTAIHKEFGHLGFACQDLRWLGDAARGLNDYVEAERCYRESLEILQVLGWTGYMSPPTFALGLTLLYQKRGEEALACFNEGLSLSLQQGEGLSLSSWQTHRVVRIQSLLCYAAVCADCARPEAAARLLGAHDAHLDGLMAEGASRNALLNPVDELEHERYLTRCREQLDPTSFDACWAAGRTMTLEQALAYGRAEAEAAVSLPSVG